MNSSVVREKFFEFFKDKQHEIIPSASVINETDKHLMFTNAGMNQFRNIFTGDQNPKFSRVANSQKCLKVRLLIKKPGYDYEYYLHIKI